jgi:hypothetical protein
MRERAMRAHRRKPLRVRQMATVCETVRLEAAPGFEPGITDLQSVALPLGYAAQVPPEAGATG